MAGYLGIEGGERKPADIVADVARAKRMPVESFRAFGAKPDHRGKLEVARVPMFDQSQKPCSHFNLALVCRARVPAAGLWWRCADVAGHRPECGHHRARSGRGVAGLGGASDGSRAVARRRATVRRKKDPTLNADLLKAVELETGASPTGDSLKWVRRSLRKLAGQLGQRACLNVLRRLLRRAGYGPMALTLPTRCVSEGEWQWRFPGFPALTLRVTWLKSVPLG